MSYNNEDMFAEQTVYRSVASRFEEPEEEQLNFEFGSGKDLGTLNFLKK